MSDQPAIVFEVKIHTKIPSFVGDPSVTPDAVYYVLAGDDIEARDWATRKFDPDCQRDDAIVFMETGFVCTLDNAALPTLDTNDYEHNNEYEGMALIIRADPETD